MDTQLRLTYDVLYYVHRKDCGGRGNMAIISEQSSPKLFDLYTYDQILTACKNLEKQRCFDVAAGSNQVICLNPVYEDICEQVLTELSIRLRQ